jgi:thymidylate synthase (FAD)
MRQTPQKSNPDFVVLNHGYVTRIDNYGSDQGIVDDARLCSGQGRFVSWESYPGSPNGDVDLLRYLWKNKVSGPFETCGMTVDVKAPIFVLRQWHTAWHCKNSPSEISGRFVPECDDNYVTDAPLCGLDASPEVHRWIDHIESVQYDANQAYQRGLEIGIPEEIARNATMMVSNFATMRVSGNLRHWLEFLTSRLDPSGTAEIRMYAEAVGNLIREKYPRTWGVCDEASKADERVDSARSAKAVA